MAYKTQDGRSKLNVAVQRVRGADIVAATPFNLFSKLPNGTIPLSIDTIILVPFASTTDPFDIGYAARGNAAAPIAASGNAYKNDTDLKAAAGTKAAATLLPGVIADASGGIQLTGTWTPTGTATPGEFMVILTYAEDGVETHSQG